MKIGILQCDDVMDDLQEEFGNYPAMFEAALKDVAADVEVLNYEVLRGEMPPHVGACDGYIATGSRHSANDDFEWITMLENFIVELEQAKKKFVGVCFGHQVLAKVLGGEVEVSERGWGVGLATNQIRIRKSWMNPGLDTLKLIVSHQEQVCKLRPGIEVLAHSEFCPYFMLQHGEHMMSVQGHPEFSEAYSIALMDKRRDRIPAERIDAGKASLQDAGHGEAMMRWMVNFIGAGCEDTA